MNVKTAMETPLFGLCLQLHISLQTNKIKMLKCLNINKYVNQNIFMAAQNEYKIHSVMSFERIYKYMFHP